MTDEMIVAGAERLSELAPAVHDHNRALLPSFKGRWGLKTEIRDFMQGNFTDCLDRRCCSELRDCVSSHESSDGARRGGDSN